MRHFAGAFVIEIPDETVQAGFNRKLAGIAIWRSEALILVAFLLFLWKVANDFARGSRMSKVILAASLSAAFESALALLSFDPAACGESFDSPSFFSDSFLSSAFFNEVFSQ